MGFKASVHKNGSYGKFKRSGEAFLGLRWRFKLGYFMGGFDASDYSLKAASKLNYETGVSAVAAQTNLGVRRGRHMCLTTYNGRGYNCGGYNSALPGFENSASKTNYQFETTSALQSTLTQTIQASAHPSKLTYSGATYGYLLGGNNGSTPAFTTCQKLNFTTEIFANIANLPAGRRQSNGITHETIRGFHLAGGDGTNDVTTCYSLEYATETTNYRSGGNNPWAARFPNQASDLFTKGYTIAGYDGTNFRKTASKLDFSSITSAAISSADSSTVRFAGASTSMETHMYMAGGYNSTSGVLTLCEKVQFKTDTLSANSSGNLPAGRYSLSAHGGF